MKICLEYPHCLAALALLAVAAGCNSGRVDNPVFSDDGQVVVFGDSWGYEAVYVANSKGVQRVSNDRRNYALSRDGRYVLSLGGLASKSRVTIYEIPTGKRYDSKIPEEAFDRDQGCYLLIGYTGEVFIEPSPAVVFTLNARHWRVPVKPIPATLPSSEEATAKCRASQPVTPKLATTDPKIYLRWQPGREWLVELKRPDEKYRAVLPPVDSADSKSQMNPIVEFGCDGWNARRTIWVRPDGSTMELLRQNDVLPRLSIIVPFMPVFFWNGYYWFTFMGPCCDIVIKDQTDPKARLKELIRERKAQWEKRGKPVAK